MSELKVEHLNVTFSVNNRPLYAVRDVSFTIGEGEIVGLVGESGSGKSAMAKALVNLHASNVETSGSVFLDKTDLLTLSEKKLRSVRGKKIGMVFQDSLSSLNPTMKVGWQIAESYLTHHKGSSAKEAFDYAVQLLELIGISQPHVRANDYPHTFSGGMRQRAMIALALAARPQLIIADEPTTALDVTVQAQILELMQEIRRKTKTSFLLITHDLSVVAGYCDRVLVMYAGKIVEEAPVEQLFQSPSHPYTQGLLKSIPRIDLPPKRPLIPIQGTPPNLFETPVGCPFAPRCGRADHNCHLKPPPTKDLSAQHRSACWHSEANETITQR